MANQHGCGYGTNAAGNGGDRAYDRLCILELHVAAKLAFRIHIDADIDNYLSGCYGVPKDVTVALLLDDSAAMTAWLYAPQADSAAAKLLEDAAGHNEMGAAFIDYNGTAYVVAVFR